MRTTFLIVLPLVLSACNRTAAPTPKAGEAAAGATEVKVTRPAKKALTRAIVQPGTVQAEEEAPIYARLTGYVAAYRVDLGARVSGPTYEKSRDWLSREYLRETRPGDVLADIAVPDLEDEARQKQALRARAETELDQSHRLFAIAKENVTSAESLATEAGAGLRRAEANHKYWESESVRIAKLVTSRTVEPQIGDETANQLQSAAATRDEAAARVITAAANARKSRIERERAEADIDIAWAKFRAADAEARRLEDLVAYTKVRAPFDGVVTRRRADKGHLANPAGGPKGEPLFTLMRTDAVRVVVEVPEADAPLVRVGDEASLIVPATGEELTRTVARAAGALDPVSRTLRVEIDLENGDGRLRPGNFVRAVLRAKLAERWTLPAAAIAKAGDQTVCFRVVDGKAVRMPVRLGRSDGTSVEVLKKLKPATADVWEDWTGDEVVIAANAAHITDGQAVRAGP